MSERSNYAETRDDIFACLTFNEEMQSRRKPRVKYVNLIAL